MAKSEKSTKLWATIGVAIILAVFVLMGVFLLSQKQINKAQLNQTNEPSTLTSEKIVDLAKNGLYENYTYKFKFKYPEYIFRYSFLEVDKETNKQDRNFVSEQSLAIPHLRVRAEKLSVAEESTIDLFNKIASIRNGQTISENTDSSSISITRIAEVNRGTLSGFTYYFEGLFYESEASFSYNLILMDNEKVVNIILGIDLPDKEVFEQVFDEVVDSFDSLG